MAIDPYEIAQRYGVQFTGELVGSEYHEKVDYSEGHWSLRDVQEAGGRITRLRVLTEYIAARGEKWCDISYIHATLPDQRIVPVRNSAALNGALWGMKGLKHRLVNWAREERVFALKLGLLDESVWSVLG